MLGLHSQWRLLSMMIDILNSITKWNLVRIRLHQLVLTVRLGVGLMQRDLLIFAGYSLVVYVYLIDTKCEG
jgi:hypothetical protein